MKTNYYVACDLGTERGCVMLGTLRKDTLTMSEVRGFANAPIREKNSLQWNIAQLYQEVLNAVAELGKYEEAIDGISCNSWGGDYLLFDADGSLIAPAYHYLDRRGEEGMREVFEKISREDVYEETGVPGTPFTTFAQLGAERSRRLWRASRLMPVADGFNYLLSGVPRVEMSSASATQLYSPASRSWSSRLLKVARLRPGLLPAVVESGTILGRLRPGLGQGSAWEDTQVVSSCSHCIAAVQAGLPLEAGESGVYLRLGNEAVMGAELTAPVINDISRELQFINEIGHGGSICFYKRLAGLRILEECRRFWKENDRELDPGVLMHLAIAETPFESLIAPDAPAFQKGDDMPLKIQEFCKETGQVVPRKPGPIVRCVLESLALHYRRSLLEIEGITGRKTPRLHLMGASAGSLLVNFIANATQVPVVVVPESTTAIGNVLVQMLALGHVASLKQARAIARKSIKTETVAPHATAWKAAYDRFVTL